MATHKRDTTGLKPIDSRTRAQELAHLSAAARQPAEPVTRVQVGIFTRQEIALKRLGVNRAALIRELLDEYLGRHAG